MTNSTEKAGSLEWVVFTIDSERLPDQRRYVLVQMAADDDLGMPASVAVGYLKFAAGDPTCPYFVVPGFGRRFVVTHWCDCLGDKFAAPLWAGKQTAGSSDACADHCGHDFRYYSTHPDHEARGCMWEDESGVACGHRCTSPVATNPPTVDDLLSQGWEVEKASLYDEEGIEGWRWISPEGDEYYEMGHWDDPPPLPDIDFSPATSVEAPATQEAGADRPYCGHGYYFDDRLNWPPPCGCRPVVCFIRKEQLTSLARATVEKHNRTPVADSIALDGANKLEALQKANDALARSERHLAEMLKLSATDVHSLGKQYEGDHVDDVFTCPSNKCKAARAALAQLKGKNRDEN